MALYAGEEFELVFTVAPNDLDEFQGFFKKEGIEVFRIGELSSEHPQQVIYKKGNKVVEIKPKGWEHFK